MASIFAARELRIDRSVIRFIQVNRRNAQWLLLALVAVAAIVTAFWALERRHGTAAGTAATDQEEAITPVQDYVRFAGETRTEQFTDDDKYPEYIAEGLRKLAGALGALNLGTPDLQVDLRVAAEHMLLNPTSNATTAVARAALLSAADAIDAPRENTAAGLRPLAASISADRTLLDQQPIIDAFFRESARSMDRLSSRGARPHDLMAVH